MFSFLPCKINLILILSLSDSGVRRSTKPTRDRRVTTTTDPSPRSDTTAAAAEPNQPTTTTSEPTAGSSSTDTASPNCRTGMLTKKLKCRFMVLINNRMFPHDLTFNPWWDLFIPQPSQLPGEHTAELPKSAVTLYHSNYKANSPMSGTHSLLGGESVIQSKVTCPRSPLTMKWPMSDSNPVPLDYKPAVLTTTLYDNIKLSVLPRKYLKHLFFHIVSSKELTNLH